MKKHFLTEWIFVFRVPVIRPRLRWGQAAARSAVHRKLFDQIAIVRGGFDRSELHRNSREAERGTACLGYIDNRFHWFGFIVFT